MKAPRGAGKARGQGGTTKKAAQATKKNSHKFKAKVTRSESSKRSASPRQGSSGSKSPTKQSTSSPSSDSTPAKTGAARGRTSKPTARSPAGSTQNSPTRKPQAKSPGKQQSPGRSPQRGIADVVKTVGRITRTPVKVDAPKFGNTPKSGKLSNTDKNGKSTEPDSSAKGKAIEKSDASKGSKDSKAENHSSEKGKKGAITSKQNNDIGNKSNDEKDTKRKSKKGKDSGSEKEEVSDKEAKKKGRKSDVERDSSDKDVKNKGKKVASEVEESDKDVKKKPNNTVDDKSDSEKETRNKEETEKERKKKSKKNEEGTNEKANKKKVKKVIEENKAVKKKDVKAVEKGEKEKDNKKKGKRTADEPVSKEDAKKKTKKQENSDKDKKKARKVNSEKEDSDKEEKKKGKKIDDTKVEKPLKVSEKVDNKIIKENQKSSPTAESPKVKVESNAKEESVDSNSSLIKPKSKTSRKMSIDSESGDNAKKNIKEKEKDSDCGEKKIPEKSVVERKDQATGEKKEASEDKEKQASPEATAPKKRGRPKGSKNKRKNDGLPPARPKKDKKKATAKQIQENCKKEKSVFSFSESDGEKEEKLVKPKSSKNKKFSLSKISNQDNSSSENELSEEENKNSSKSKVKGKALKQQKSAAPRKNVKKVLGSKISKLKKEPTSKAKSHKKQPKTQAKGKKGKKSSPEASQSEDEIEKKKVPRTRVSHIVMRSDDSDTSENEDIKKALLNSVAHLKLKAEVTDDEQSDDDEDWSVRKGKKKKNNKNTKKKREAKISRTARNKVSIKKQSDKSDGDESDADEDDVDADTEDNKDNKGNVKSKIKVEKDRESHKKGKDKSHVKVESSSDEEDEDEEGERNKTLSKKRSKVKSSKDEKRKGKKVTFGKKLLREDREDSSEDESDKDSDSDYDAHSRKKKTGKSILKSKKPLMKEKKKRREDTAPPRGRTVRMASLNAIAMMHCMNEDARMPLPALPAPPLKSESMALVLREPTPPAESNTDDDTDDDRDYSTHEGKKRRKNTKRKNEEETEKKVKKKSKRRVGELDVHMEVRDMVAKKRMAHLNASAIMTASYSNESRRRNPTANTSSSAESEVTHVDIKRKISVKSTKNRCSTTRNVITVEETTKKVKKAQGSRETEVEEHIIVKKKVKRQSGLDTDREEDSHGTDNLEIDPDMLPKSPGDPEEQLVESTLTYITTQTPAAPQTVTISGVSTYCISSSDGKTTTMVKEVKRKSTTTACSTSAPPTAYIPPTHHVQPQPPQKPANYTPLGALSTMQPAISPGGTTHHHHHHHHHHHQQQPPPHHPPPHAYHPPPPHHQPPPQPHHQPPPHHTIPPPHSVPPSPHNHSPPYYHHPHHQQYPPTPPSSIPHGSQPPGHHCGYRPPHPPPPSGPHSQGPVPPVGPPMSAHGHPNQLPSGYMPTSHAGSPMSPTQSTSTPHHSPKQIASPTHMSSGLKSPTGASSTHPPSSSPRSAPMPGLAERHNSAFTAPTPSAHTPAALAPTGPSSQSTICFPVDPKNVHTGPPTGSGRGPEGSGSNMEECSSGGQAGGQYQYRPGGQPHQAEASQECVPAPVYQAGSVAAVMGPGNQPTIQVYGAVVPQPPVTLMTAQNSHSASTPHPNAPPVPAPVPPVVPLSQPQPAATTTIVAMAPITVTLPINPGTHAGPQAAVAPTQQPDSSPAARPGNVQTAAPLPQLTGAYVSGIAQPGVASTQVTACMSNMAQPVVTPAQVTMPVISGIPQHSVTHAQVTSSLTTGVNQALMVQPTIATAFVTGMPQPSIAPTKVTTAFISGIPQPSIAPTKVTTAVVSGVPQTAVAPESAALAGGSAVSQTNDSAAKVVELPQVSVSGQVIAPGTRAVPLTQASTQVLTAVVTGIPKPSVSVVHVNASGINEVSQAATVGTTPTTFNERQVDKVEPQVCSTSAPGMQQCVRDGNMNVDNGSILSSQGLKHAQRVSTAVVPGIPKNTVETLKAATAIVSRIPKQNGGSQQGNTGVVSGMPKTQGGHVSASNVAGKQKTITSQSNTAIVSGVPRVSVVPPQPASSVVPTNSHTGPMAKHHMQGVNNASSPSRKPASLTSTDAVPISKEISSPKVSVDFSKAGKHKKVQNVLAEMSEQEKPSDKTYHISEVQPSPTDAINSVPDESVVSKGAVNKKDLKTLYPQGEAIKNTCPVSPLNASGVEIKQLSIVKKEKDTVTTKENERVLDNTSHPVLSIPEFPDLDSRANTSWNPTQHSDTSNTSDFIVANNHSTNAGCDSKVFSPASKTSLSVTDHAASASKQVVNRARTATTNNASSQLKEAVLATDIQSVVAPSDIIKVGKEEGSPSRKNTPRANVSSKSSQKLADEGGRVSLQRPGTRHLLCQTLPSPTKIATASVAKAKTTPSLTTNRMLVKSEDKSKDMKPHIPDSIPCNSVSQAVKTSKPMLVNHAKKEVIENQNDKAEIGKPEPIVRKRGRPPKVRDSSSDSSSPPSESASPSHHPSSHSPKTKQDANTTPEKKAFSPITENKRSRSSVKNFIATKTLRSHSEERKKSNAQTSPVSTSPSKQMDSKQDVKSGTVNLNIKTETIPKIKTEKVSPKGVNKSLKVSPKEMPLIKNKLENGQDETSFKSSHVSKKCDLSSPTKVEFPDTKKFFKSVRELKRSPSSSASEQKFSKNNEILTKSKFKEIDDKKPPNTSLKRKSNESLINSNKVIQTKSKESETKMSGNTKQTAQKVQKASKTTKGRKAHPNGKLNRNKSLLAYLKERNNESDTSSVDSEAAGGGRKRSKSKEESPKSTSASPFPPSFPSQPITAGTRRRSATGHGKCKLVKKPRWVHNWSWEGEPFEGKVWLRNDEPPLVRTCYPAMRHKEGDIVRVRDCVLLRSGPKKNDIPFVAKIAALWEDSETSDMMMSILWYYRPEHTESGRRPDDLPDEIFASKHRDHLSVACIEDRCYVLTFNEYCRYRRFLRLFQEGVYPITTPVPDPEEGYSRKDRQPPGCVVQDLLFFCRRVYDYRQKRLLKNPY